MKNCKFMFSSFFAIVILACSMPCQAANQPMLDNPALWTQATTLVLNENASFIDADCKYSVDENENCFYLSLSFTTSAQGVVQPEITANLMMSGEKNYMLELPSGVPMQTIDGIRTNSKLKYDTAHRRISYIVAVDLPTKSDFSIAANFQYNKEEIRVQHAIKFDLTPTTTARTTTARATTSATTQKPMKATTVSEVKAANAASKKSSNANKKSTEKHTQVVASTTIKQEPDVLVLEKEKNFFQRMNKPGKVTFLIAIALGIMALVVTSMTLTNAKKVKMAESESAEDETQPKE